MALKETAKAVTPPLYIVYAMCNVANLMFAEVWNAVYEEYLYQL